MNSKKHKKNRAKVHPIPPQKKENVDIDMKNIEDVQLIKNDEVILKQEDVIKDTSEVKEPINVLNSEKNVQIRGEIMETVKEGIPCISIEGTPIKPKRSKGKKKKHNVIESNEGNISDENKVIEKVEDKKSVPEMNLTSTATQELFGGQPCARKKKNKGKKHDESEARAEGKSDLEIEHNPQSEIEEDKMKHEVETDVKSSNKKNKKKIRRHDSEKSEKTDEQISCTAAFKELVDSKTDGSNFNDTAEIKQNLDVYKEDINIECVENPNIMLSTEDQAETDFKNSFVIVAQKKKKKEKKHPPTSKNDSQDLIQSNVDIKYDAANSDGTNEEVHHIVTDENTLLQSSTTHDPKPKAKIAKPVQRKPIHCLDTDTSVVEIGENMKLISNVNSQSERTKVEDRDTISSTDLTEDAELMKSSESSNLSQNLEMLRPPEENITNIECCGTKGTNDIIRKEKCDHSAIILENIAVLDNIDNTSKIQPDTDSKTSNKNLNKEFKNILEDIPDAGIEISEDILDKCGKCECSENEKILNKNLYTEEVVDTGKTIKPNEICDNTPDFIHIPRSSSHQQLDYNNNNTVIHEITSVDEMKLGIPVLTSNIVQGSGETPVSTPNIISTDISVTEMESIPAKVQEKTDLKSKMMEVNHDLEELKLSLEKSLAELTAIEENEEKTEKMQCENVEMITEEMDKLATGKLEEESNVYKPLTERLYEIENKFTTAEVNPATNIVEEESTADNIHKTSSDYATPPICPSRKDRKGKGKSKKRGRREPESYTSQPAPVSSETKSEESNSEKKSEEKKNTSEEKGKQQCSNENKSTRPISTEVLFEPIENFEDALTSSIDELDVNKTFEIIANEVHNDSKNDQPQKEACHNKPEINITPPIEEVEKEKQQKNVNPVSQPKNLLGYPNIPVPSNKTDYKKEKNKTPNSKQAKIKIKDVADAEPDTASLKRSKQSQTDNKIKFAKDGNEIESFSYKTNEKQEYVYKYSFRKVFLTSACHVCRKQLKQTRVPCKFCNLVFYCSQKHKDEDWPRHQSLCFAVSTIVHLKDQKHIYADAKNISGQNYRLIRMQMILSCEKVLKRKLLPWEQEALLYPRICADVQCREWKQSKLLDCEGCGQVSYCIEHPEHLPEGHQRWCKSYALYQKLVLYQQSNGRLEPKLPGKVMVDDFVIPDKINEVLASMYEEKIDMSDIQYAALTQLATAPLTAAHCHQLYRQHNCSNGISKKSTFTIHAVGAELQFEADSFSKWEVFLLHLKPAVKDLRVALIGPELNPSNLPLDLLGNIKLCENCSTNKRRVQFSFQDKKSYHEYWASDEFTVPDIVCAFNSCIQRSSMYNGMDSWTSTINCILKQKIPFLLTSHTLEELGRDLECIKNYAEVNYKFMSEPKYNAFASVRPDRNFITDDETPLLFKNYCLSVLCGV